MYQALHPKSSFRDRRSLRQSLNWLGYEVAWRVLNSSDYGVPQLRPRFILVALQYPYFDNFSWPLSLETTATVGQILHDLMASRGWPGANQWFLKANSIAPTLVGGSKKLAARSWPHTRKKAVGSAECRWKRDSRCATRRRISYRWISSPYIEYGCAHTGFS